MTPLDTILYNEKIAAKHIKVATTAMCCERDPDKNRIKMITTINTILQMHPDVELVIFGEMILGWYIPGKDREYHHRISESIPGETTLA